MNLIQWSIGLNGEHIALVIFHRYTKVLQRQDLTKFTANREAHTIISDEAVAMVFN